MKSIIEFIKESNNLNKISFIKELYKEKLNRLDDYIKTNFLKIFSKYLKVGYTLSKEWEESKDNHNKYYKSYLYYNKNKIGIFTDEISYEGGGSQTFKFNDEIIASSGFNSRISENDWNIEIISKILNKYIK